jgi:hypothetical protein
MRRDLKILMGFESNLPTLGEAMLARLVDEIETEVLKESASSEARDLSLNATAASKQTVHGTGHHRPGHAALHMDAAAWHGRAEAAHAAAKIAQPEGSDAWKHHASMEKHHGKLAAIHQGQAGVSQTG